MHWKHKEGWHVRQERIWAFDERASWEGNGSWDFLHQQAFDYQALDKTILSYV